jgi:inositol-phosphate phosphatase/L-galactose 1-phosphate phosphatase/histidinol-phosphatase
MSSSDTSGMTATLHLARQLATDLADAAGEVIRPYFRTRLNVDRKADQTPVTVADREAERVMREMLSAQVPQHGVIGEEFGSDRPDAEWVWVLDPIDGTKAFISGQPTFGTLIALLHNGEPILGVIDQPVLHERWIGTAEGTTFNGESTAVRRQEMLSAATLYATDPAMFLGSDADAFGELSLRCGLTRYGLDCYAYGLLALGFVDLVVEAEMQLYDYAALVPIVEGAGGRISDWEGRPLRLLSEASSPRAAPTGGRVIAAGDSDLLELALGHLRGE